MGYDIGVLIISPDGAHTPLSVKLDFSVTNNEVEYEACILGLQAAIALGVRNLRVYGDSSLIINQILGKWKVRSEGFSLYQTYLENMLKYFENRPQFTYLSREENQFADALEKLASMISIPNELDNIPLCIERREQPAYYMTMEDTSNDRNPWFRDNLNYHIDKDFPPNSDIRTQRAIKRLAAQYIHSQGKLYKKSPQGILLLFVDEKVAQRIMDDVHSGTCGPHMNGRMLAKKNYASRILLVHDGTRLLQLR
ncbi:uncharacterized protein LOC141631017 [Silene latifolia]|uniref:uncharacterized protein LOC141631017 n=1 Tax=Silene latifolia TaxID=37657 RepID=UPI003D7887FA